MSPRRFRPPKLCLHKATGQAFVRVAGKAHYLGKYGTPRAQRRYAKVLEQLSSQAQQEHDEAAAFIPRDCNDLTICELVAAYWPHARTHYCKHGEPTRTLDNIRLALEPLVERHATLAVRDFGPLLLKALRERMLDQETPQGERLSRGVVNERVRIIRQVFRWGVSEELVPVAVYEALRTVAGLQQGRSRARETQPVSAVPDVVIDATIAKLPMIVADMVRFQRLTGCRPGEVCTIRPCDVTRFERHVEFLPLFAGEQPQPRKLDVWEYRPARHKTEHHGKQRVILIGPKAQEVLLPYLARPAEAFCFSPAESETRRRLDQRAKRKSRVQPSQQNRRMSEPRRSPRLRYTKDSYAKAIARACDAAFPPPEDLDDRDAVKAWRRARRWSPNQLRHTAATAIRKAHGAEKARVVLGHTKLSTTEIYAERDLSEAASIMRKMG